MCGIFVEGSAGGQILAVLYQIAADTDDGVCAGGNTGGIGAQLGSSDVNGISCCQSLNVGYVGRISLNEQDELILGKLGAVSIVGNGNDLTSQGAVHGKAGAVYFAAENLITGNVVKGQRLGDHLAVNFTASILGGIVIQVAGVAIEIIEAVAPVSGVVSAAVLVHVGQATGNRLAVDVQAKGQAGIRNVGDAAVGHEGNHATKLGSGVAVVGRVDLATGHQVLVQVTVVTVSRAAGIHGEEGAVDGTNYFIAGLGSQAVLVCQISCAACGTAKGNYHVILGVEFQSGCGNVNVFVNTAGESVLAVEDAVSHLISLGGIFFERVFRRRRGEQTAAYGKHQQRRQQEAQKSFCELHKKSPFFSSFFMLL